MGSQQYCALHGCHGNCYNWVVYWLFPRLMCVFVVVTAGHGSAWSDGAGDVRRLRWSEERRGIRLVDGKSNGEGRVEVFALGEWGTVCDDNWTSDNTQVICKQLGFGLGVKLPSSPSDDRRESLPIWLDNVQCVGNERTLFACLHGGLGEHNCEHDEDVFVRCTPALQVTKTPPPTKVMPTPPSNSSSSDYSTFCNTTHMQLFLSKTALVDIVRGEGDLHLTNASCVSEDNSTHYVLTATLPNGCGTVARVVNSEILFTNRVIKENAVNITFSCALPTVTKVTFNSSVEVDHPRLIVRAIPPVPLRYRMRFLRFNDTSFRWPQDDKSGTISLQSESTLNLEISPERDLPLVSRLFVKSCKAWNHLVTVHLIKDSNSTERRVVVFNSSAASVAFRFQVLASLFLGRFSKPFFIECRVHLCANVTGSSHSCKGHHIHSREGRSSAGKSGFLGRQRLQLGPFVLDLAGNRSGRHLTSSPKVEPTSSQHLHLKTADNTLILKFLISGTVLITVVILSCLAVRHGKQATPEKVMCRPSSVTANLCTDVS